MAQPVPGTAASSSTSSGLSLTYACTVAAGENCLVVDVGYGATSGGEFAASVTFNGVALTKKWGPVSDGNWVSAEQWYLVDPPVGTFNVIVSNGFGGAQIGSGATPYSGVETASPFGTAVTASGATTSASTGSVTSDPLSLVIGAIASDSEGGITEDGTLLWEIQNIAADTSDGGQYKSTSPATLNWTLVQAGWACGGVSLHGIDTGAAAVAVSFRQFPKFPLRLR